ncbi:MAG: GTP-binding protein [Candidatus Lokiarchaeota archaeon]|nr:GTP-binding protein [Candidatus Lokiarchaeota archaeon]
MASYDFTFTVLLLGDPSSGKEEFVHRYISPFFLDESKLTIGVDFYTKTQECIGKKVKLQFWVFGGEERFRFLLHQYCKGKNGAIIMYDITNRQSLDHLPDWTQIIREQSGEIPIILIGNKLDLEKSREVSKEEGIAIAKKYNLSAYTELSSKTGQNVEKTFTVLTEILIESYSKTYG